MYPYIRFGLAVWAAGRLPALQVGETHVSHHTVLPWDIDPFLELNNGRILTLYDIGRLSLFRRMGIIPVMRQHGWTGVVAGSSVRYRRRLRQFHRFEMRSTVVGWDNRFIYADQSMWRDGTCTNQALLRLAIAAADGIVAPPEIAKTMGLSEVSPPLPAWIQAWIDAEGTRPWPPI